MPVETPDTRFASEKAGLPVVKTIEEVVEAMPFHRHTGVDGSPKIDFAKVDNKEDSEGGKYVDSNSTATINISGAWATLSALNASKKIVGSKRFLIILSGVFMYSGLSGSQVEMRFDVDGTDTATLAVFLDNDGELNGDQLAFSFHFITSILSAATHTFTVEGRSVTGSGVLSAPIFSIIELTN